MILPDKAISLRIFVGERDHYQDKPTYEALVLKAREMHLAGATVLRSPMGYGNSSLLHTANILRLSDDLPMVVEIIDAREKIEAFLPVLKAIVRDGLVTMHEITVFHYGAKND
jgi:hypothetical protein